SWATSCCLASMSSRRASASLSGGISIVTVSLLISVPVRSIDMSLDVSTSQLQVAFIDRAGAGDLVNRHLTNHTARNPHDHGACRYLRAFNDHAAGRDHALGANLASGEKPGPDADQRIRSNRRAVNHSRVSRDHTRLNRQRNAVVRVQNATILNVNA